MHVFNEWASDVRYALRAWRRQPVFVAIAVLSLAAGIGLNTAVFSIVNAIFLQAIRGVPQPDRVAAIGARVSFTTFRDLRDSLRTLDGVAAWQPVPVRLRYRDVTLRRVVPAVSGNYFDVLGVRPARGRFFDADRQRVPAASAEVVIDFEFWTDAFGSDPQAIGETIFLNGAPATIVGVAPQAFHGFGPERPSLWIPMGMLPAMRGGAPQWDSPAESGWRVFGRIADSGSIGQVNAELLALSAREPGRFPVASLRAGTGRERFTGNASAEKRIEFLLVVVLPLVVAGLILWIGCSNVANLLLARAAARRKEIAIRMANGAGRARLVRLLLTESLLLAFAGGAAGVLLAAWGRDLIWAVLPEAPRLAIELDLNVLLYTGAVCIAATALFGLVPALHATRVDVAPLLKTDDASAFGAVRRSGRLRTFFLVTQFAASTALLLVAGTFVRTIVATHLGDRAASMDRITLASVDPETMLPADRAEFWRVVRERIRQVPGVTAVTLMPAAGARPAQLTVAGPGPEERLPVRIQQIDAEFFRLSDAAVILGSELPAGGRPDSTLALVNERVARQARLGDTLVGPRLSLDETPITIVGIVRDGATEGRLYRQVAEDEVESANILIRTTEPAATVLGAIRSTLSPVTPVGTATVVPLRDASTGMLQRLTGMSLVVATLVLALAGIGLYGSVAFITIQRTREIAIRMAVGAPRGAVLRMLAWEGGSVVLFGCVAGLAMTGIAFRFMSGMIFARWTLDPFAVTGVLVTFAAATFAACFIPGRRATKIDPIQLLRSD